MIGRDVWYVGTSLFRGRIVKHNIDSNAVVLDCGIHGPHDLVIHATSALLTTEAAIMKIEETIEYWNDQLKKLEAA